MSILPSAKKTWNPSKEFIAAVRECYFNNQPIDLTKFSAEDWVQAVAFSETAEKLRGKNPTKEDVNKFIYDLIDASREVDLESLCSFGNISFVIDFNLHDCEKLVESLRYVIDNKVPMKEACVERLVCAPINFQNLLKSIDEEWFENWRDDSSVIVGSIFVDLCDYLKINVEPIGESVGDWDVEECDIEDIAETNKEDLKSFSRLFSKPMDKWYPRNYCD